MKAGMISLQMPQSCSIMASQRKSFSKMTFRIAPPAVTQALTPPISSRRYPHSPERTLPMLTTMSISSAPSLTACFASSIFSWTVPEPCGKPTTVPVRMPVPSSSFAAMPTKYGLMQTLAQLRSTATAMPLISCSSSSMGWSSEWSIIRASSSTVQSGIRHLFFSRGLRPGSRCSRSARRGASGANRS